MNARFRKMSYWAKTNRELLRNSAWGEPGLSEWLIVVQIRIRSGPHTGASDQMNCSENCLWRCTCTPAF
jgi:hypothetical protein